MRGIVAGKLLGITYPRRSCGRSLREWQVRTNYVLVDFESVQPEVLDGLDSEFFQLLIFVGASQVKLPFDVAASVQALGDRARYIKIAGNGPNALDFHIAFYIGELAAADPTGFFHIVSKDKGFDPLIAHLKARKILSGRVASIQEIPLVKTSTAQSLVAKVACVAERLGQPNMSRPRALKTLASTIKSLFPSAGLDEEGVQAIIAALQKQGTVSVDGTKVSYPGLA